MAENSSSLMAQKKRGRPPGSKKKPDPTISVRIPEEILGLLRQLAQKNKRTLSGEILARLQHTFGHYQKGGIDPEPHLRPLVDAFALTAGYLERRFGRRWYESRFVSRELAKVFGFVMVEFSAADDAVPPKVVDNAKRHGSGEEIYLARPGEEEAHAVIMLLRTASRSQTPYAPFAEWEQELWRIRRDLEHLERRKQKK
jgi:Arc-like DNA binding domain